MRHSDGKNGHTSSSGGSAGRGKGRSATGSLGRPPRTAAASDGGGAIRKRPAVGVAGAVDDEGEGRGDRLTDRQRQVLQYISQSIHSRGYPPTLREIGQHMQIRSTNGVNDHLRALEKKGYLERHDLKSRALRVKEPSVGATGPETDDRDGGLRRAAGQAMVTAARAGCCSRSTRAWCRCRSRSGSSSEAISSASARRVAWCRRSPARR